MNQSEDLSVTASLLLGHSAFKYISKSCKISLWEEEREWHCVKMPISHFEHLGLNPDSASRLQLLTSADLGDTNHGSGPGFWLPTPALLCCLLAVLSMGHVQIDYVQTELELLHTLVSMGMADQSPLDPKGRKYFFFPFT